MRKGPLFGYGFIVAVFALIAFAMMTAAPTLEAGLQLEKGAIGDVAGGCTNQFVRAIVEGSAPTCESVGTADTASGLKFMNTFTSDAPYDPASLAAGASRTDSVAVTGIVAGRWLGCNPGTVADLGNCVPTCAAVSNGFAAIHWYNGDDGVGGTACNPDETTWVFVQPAS